ncbi:MAG: sulfite exporter TauE/SafE family protein [Bacteroidia bacterium]
MMIIGYILGLLIGALLGLFGSGGAIISFPVLVYFINIPAQQAGVYSLLIVGLAALVGVIKQWKMNHVDFKVAAIFTVPLLAGFYLTKNYLLPIIPQEIARFSNVVFTKNHLIMLLFILTLSYIVTSMFTQASDANQDNLEYQEKNWYLGKIWRFVVSAIGVGILSASIGAGGGFIIVPALMSIFHLPVKKATGTSLFIISVNAFLGTLMNKKDFSDQHIPIILTFSLISIVGMFIGLYLNKILSAITLKKSYAYFLILILASTIFSEIYKIIHASS